MTKELEFFIYLLEYYAEYKERTANEVMREWDRLGITQTIFDNYWGYHTERLENAYADIDRLIAAGNHTIE